VGGGGGRLCRRLDGHALGQLTRAGRTTGWGQLARGSLGARGELFGGTATHYLDVRARGDERFAGASLDVQYQFRGGLAAGVELDAIRCFDRDANLEGRVAGSGARAFLTLSYTFELHHQDLDLAPPLPDPAPPADAPPAPATPPPP